MKFNVGDKVIYLDESFDTSAGTIEQGMVGTIWGYPDGMEETRTQIRVEYPDFGKVFGMRTSAFRKYTKLDAVLK